jgi:uncharacterized protein
MPTVLIKPVGDRCNLACRHCFYHPEIPRRAAVMEDDVLAATIRGFLADGGPMIFAWQGGEPSLAGLDFYRRALDLQRRLAGPGQHVANTFQTNGVLIDDDWADFLAANQFLVGLSIDGPEECHDALRTAADGSGSHSRAVQAWRALQRHKCPTNILCVVHCANFDKGSEVYDYLTRGLGADYLQFIPCVEWTASGEVADFSLRPGDYARFLMDAFDRWSGEKQRAISVKLFDDFVLFLAGKPMRDCMHRTACDAHLVVEHDGSVYPCDFFVREELRLGNIVEETAPQLRREPRAVAFQERKARELPAECRDCRHLDICQGGCCKFWRPAAEGGFMQYLCEDMKQFLDQCRPAMEGMAAAVRARWRHSAADR